MKCSSSLRRSAAACFSAVVLAAVPVAAWVTFAPALLPDAQAAIAPAGHTSADEFAVQPLVVENAGGDTPQSVRSESDPAASIRLLNAWVYTDHDCRSDRGEERGNEHKPKDKPKKKSPKDCPDPGPPHDPPGPPDNRPPGRP